MFEVQALKMGYDIYFRSPDLLANTVVIHATYSFNVFYTIFNIPNFKGQTGDALQPQLKTAIAAMNKEYRILEQSKDPYKPTPGNYLQVLTILYNYAKLHPTWIFHCD
jgi:hypothetical protein